jgi:hypothetical protein
VSNIIISSIFLGAFNFLNPISSNFEVSIILKFSIKSSFVDLSNGTPEYLSITVVAHLRRLRLDSVGA